MIPTKEQVFPDYLEHNSKISFSDVTDKLLVNERSALAQTFSSWTTRTYLMSTCCPH